MRGPISLPHAAIARLLAAWAACVLAGCDNNPWPHDAAASNTLFTAAKDTSPRHLDPTASYWSNETPYTLSIYEPPYGYHYLKRPIELMAKSAVDVAKPHYVDKNGPYYPKFTYDGRKALGLPYG